MAEDAIRKSTKLIRDLIIQQAARTADKQRLLREKFNASAEQIESEVAAAAQRNDESLKQKRADQLNRLRGLIEKKYDIEAEIRRETHELAEAQGQAREELEVVLCGRKDDLNVALKGVEDMAETRRRDTLDVGEEEG